MTTTTNDLLATTRRGAYRTLDRIATEEYIASLLPTATYSRGLSVGYVAGTGTVGHYDIDGRTLEAIVTGDAVRLKWTDDNRGTMLGLHSNWSDFPAVLAGKVAEMTVEATTITDEQITQLQTEADAHGDSDMYQPTPNTYNPYYLTRHPSRGFKTIDAAKAFAKTQAGQSHTIKNHADRGRVVGSGFGLDFYN